MDDATPTRSLAKLPADWPQPEALGFGAYLAPLLVSCEHDGQQWSAPLVLPRDAVRLAIASGGLQYGLSVFEGLKAYRAPDGRMHFFRPQDHARRLAASARRLCLPEISDELFLQSCRLAAQAHEAFLPPHGRGSLYLRPTIHADEESLGLKRASRHRYTVTVTPCSDPPLKTLRLWAEPELIRAAPGGLGAAKTGANYAAGLGGLMRARELGYDDVIWLDATTHRWLGEAGTMNLFVQIGRRLVTPPLDGTILAGVTRDCVLQIARGLGLEAVEAPLNLEGLQLAARRGELACAFGTGTAARLASIRDIGTPQGNIELPDSDLPQKLAARLKQLQEGSSTEHPRWRIAI
jgi:branched-chain amino acid aminotransferase